MKYVTLLPFMDREELTELAHKILNKEIKGVNIVTLYPFLDDETLNEIADAMIEKGNAKKITSLLPFISRKKVSELYQAVKEGKVEGVKESYFLPFLDKKAIKEMFYDLVQKASEEDDEDDFGVDFDDE